MGDKPQRSAHMCAQEGRRMFLEALFVIWGGAVGGGRTEGRKERHQAQ